MREHSDSFTIRRQLRASIDRVWDAWINPAELTHWHRPKGFVLPPETISLDLRPGGSFSYTLVDERSGEQFPTVGLYLEVVKPVRLVFTWGEPGQAQDLSPLATVILSETANGTDMIFALERSGGRPGDGFVHDMWVEALDALVSHIEDFH